MENARNDIKAPDNLERDAPAASGAPAPAAPTPAASDAPAPAPAANDAPAAPAPAPAPAAPAPAPAPAPAAKRPRRPPPTDEERREMHASFNDRISYLCKMAALVVALVSLATIALGHELLRFVLMGLCLSVALLAIAMLQDHAQHKR